MDPEKIELEFSLTRRRYGRKRQVESGGDLPFKVGAKLRRTSLACRESFSANLRDNEILHGKSKSLITMFLFLSSLKLLQEPGKLIVFAILLSDFSRILNINLLKHL